jgi:hypothetical protein
MFLSVLRRMARESGGVRGAGGGGHKHFVGAPVVSLKLINFITTSRSVSERGLMRHQAPFHKGDGA